ncbi:MAG: phosphoribosylformylglycinamidine synthase subunit PurL, partial [Sphingomonadales bacterium]|nr:phosphoribosylformylglycinamidine synthase subunit PurL [Sphingomonadales bacterium]
AFYGNCFGVPTVGGEVVFEPCYSNNPLVNALALGIARREELFFARARGAGNPVIYAGAKTGRDGIHGASLLASAEFSEESQQKRPNVQVGDPFTEKLLIEACLELMATDAIVAIQDMGAAGLTSSSVEMATNGEAGIRLDMNKVPCREEGMTPYEMMLSESQERMLMVLKPGKEAMAEAIFRKWELDFAVIGEVTDTRHMVLEFDGEVVCDIPLGPLAADAPLYDRPALSKADYKAWAKVPALKDVPEQVDIGADLVKMMGSPALASRRWIWEQYDSQVGADTLQKSGGDAAVVRIHGTHRALAMSTDCTPRYCYADPYEGGKQAVAETWRNICAVGAKPLAITNCLNFANPQRPEIMAQITGCLEGMGDACRALDYPIVSGNVSLYNESKATGGGSAILPTPAIGGVGVLDDIEKMATIAFKDGAQKILLIGADPRAVPELGQSLWLDVCHGMRAGPPPKVDLKAERAHGEFVRDLIAQGIVTAAHDVSDGGILVAVTEMALASGIGARMELPSFEDLVDSEKLRHAWSLFAENQGRFLVTEPFDSHVVEKMARERDIGCCFIGWTGGESIVLGVGADSDHAEVALSDLREASEAFFRDWMEA